MVNNWINIIQDCVFPPTCILCGNKGENSLDICQFCYSHLPRNEKYCFRCAENLDETDSISDICGRCLSHNPAYDRTYAPFLYRGAMSHLITTLKFNAKYQNARLLGKLLSEFLKQNADKPGCIIPVPLHKKRYRQRGCNQAIEIARVVAKDLQIPLNLESCIRRRDTPHQTGLAAKQRRKNIKNAFAIVKPIEASHVAVIDDVMTTGSTAQELAALLKKNGVGRVDIWVCARA